MNNIVVQAIGVVAMLFNIFSYQQKTVKKIIIFQMLGGLFFSINFLLLNAYVGALLNVVATIRAVLFLKKEELKTDNNIWFVSFCVVYVLAYVASFALFGKNHVPLNFIIELLPVIGMVATTLAFRHSSAKIVRYYGLASSISWLIYNIVSLSLGAICCEAISIVSIFVALWRYDRKIQ